MIIINGGNLVDVNGSTGIVRFDTERTKTARRALPPASVVETEKQSSEGRERGEVVRARRMGVG